VAGHLLGNRYRLDTEIGRGGMATVWQGLDMNLDRPVAVKVLDRARPADPAAPAAIPTTSRPRPTVSRLVAHPRGHLVQIEIEIRASS
jgi:serine/threonine-protein kinase